jgi:hypothetical protein
MSEATIACGFVDGSLILSSLSDQTALVKIRPFRIAISSLSHVADDRVAARWGACAAEISPSRVIWTELPQYPGGLGAVLCDSGAIAVARPDGVVVYSFADREVIARVPQKPRALWCNGRRIYVMTLQCEIVVLYIHDGVKIEAQFHADVDSPTGIVAANQTAYVICDSMIAVFGAAGQRLSDGIPLSTKLRLYDSSSHCVFLTFGKAVWCIGKDQTVSKQRVDGYPTALAAVDDQLCAVAVGGRVTLIDFGPTKVSRAGVGASDKRIVAMKAFTGREISAKLALMVLFNDGTTAEWEIPPPK